MKQRLALRELRAGLEQIGYQEMRLQVGIYAVAAKRELEYQPDKGLVRYLDVDREHNDKHELEVPLDDDSVADAKKTVIVTATAIRDRKFKSGPKKAARDGQLRCKTCDFLGFCGMPEPMSLKRS